ncbi:transmembrane protein 141 isoform X5 [Mustela putorius furo]|uniref:Transmembrane protein 141 isoform X5 n=1 Tax=Mustela putorius furo TaxID=9669 RepID=A0A8U0V4P4_MUSPF|nr:transmembrane protein 141 isoform X5 [Mustela putorius furo]
MVNLGLSRVDDAVAAKHPLCRRRWTGWLMGTLALGRHRRRLRPADVHPEEVPVPLPVACAGGRGSAQLGELHLGRRRPGAENFEPSGPPHLRLALPPHTGPPHSLR